MVGNGDWKSRTGNFVQFEVGERRPLQNLESKPRRRTDFGAEVGRRLKKVAGGRKQGLEDVCGKSGSVQEWERAFQGNLETRGEALTFRPQKVAKRVKVLAAGRKRGLEDAYGKLSRSRVEESLGMQRGSNAGEED